jgi:hypothetical protein
MNKYSILLLLTLISHFSFGQLKEKVSWIDTTCGRIDSMSDTFKHYLYLSDAPMYSSNKWVDRKVWLRYAIDTATKKFARIIKLEKKPITFYYSNLKLIKLTVKEIKSDVVLKEANYYFENWKLLAKQDKFGLVRDVGSLIREAKDRNFLFLYR